MNIVKLGIDFNGLPIVADPDAMAERATALAEMSEVTQVENPGEQDRAVRRARKAKILVKEAEKSRKAILAPVRELTAQINGIHEKYSQPIEVEINRIDTMCAQFQKREDDRLAEEQRKRDEENRKAEAERVAAQKRVEEAKAREAELQQQAKEGKLTNEEAQAMAELETAEAVETARAAEEKARAVSVAKEPERHRAHGQRVTNTVLYEVEDIEALAKARPDLVTIEPNRARIREILTADLKLPGVRIWVEKRSATVA